MQSNQLLNVVIISALIGFAAFVVSYAAHVWRHRNRGTAGNHGSGRVWLRRGGWSLIFVGVIGLAGASLWREFVDRQGVLKGDQLFTVRAREGWTVEHLFDGDKLTQGKTVAQLRSPEQAADFEVLQLRRQAMEKRQAMLSHQPLELDPNLIRQIEENAAQRRQLRATLSQLLSQRYQISREMLTQRLAKEERLREVIAGIDQTRQEIQQVTSQVELETEQLQQISSLAKRNLADKAKLSEQRTEVEVQKAEMSKLTGRLTNLQRQKTALRQELKSLNTVTNEQTEGVTGEIERTRAQLEQIQQKADTLQSQLERDRERAQTVRDQELAKLDLELSQLQAQAQGVKGTLTIDAPFRGRVAYRDTSPNAAEAGAPVLILAPPQGFHLQTRLPQAEVAALATAGSVSLELADPMVQRRFTGQLVDVRPLPDDPRHSLAKLQVQPPERAIRGLAAGDKVEARLRWRPPLTTTPMFLPTALALALGMLALIGSHLPRRRPATADEGEAPSAPADSQLALGTVAGSPGAANVPDSNHELEYGAIASVLEMLSLRLKEAVKRGDPDHALLATIAWNIDRHHSRAVELLASRLGNDEDFLTDARGTLEQLAAAARHDERTSVEGARERYKRLLFILRAIAPSAVTAYPPLAVVSSQSR